MNISRDLFYLFTKNEIKFFIIIFFGTLLTTILDVISFASIIPIFKIIFLNKEENINFFKLGPVNLDLNLKYELTPVKVIVPERKIKLSVAR
jgi:hypothetical protein